jgi:hypothetical protein
MLKNVSKGDNMNFHEVSIINIMTAYKLGWITFDEALERLKLLKVI